MEQKVKMQDWFDALDKGDTKAIEALVRGGARVDTADEYGQTALMYAAGAGGYGQDRTELVQILLALGADVNAQSQIAGDTALMGAVSYGRPEIVRLLLGAGADVNLQDFVGKSALMTAVEYGYSDCVRLLIQAGADATQTDRMGDSAMSKAISRGRLDIADVLRGR